MAFYSSELGGIVTDPALMVVSADDHMVHRGHAVFDTATLTQGYLYQLDDHLDRFYRSASKAALTPPFPRNQIRRIILETAAATKSFEGDLACQDILSLPDVLITQFLSLIFLHTACKGLLTGELGLAGNMRYWLGAGRGSFGISPLECLQTSFYCVAYKSAESPDPSIGWKVKTSPVPIKDPYFATLKSTNYLANALVALDAQLEGFDQVLGNHPSPQWPLSSMGYFIWLLLGMEDQPPSLECEAAGCLCVQGVFVDSEGYVAEGPVMNIGIITHEGEMVVPPFEQTLAGVTLQRLLHLVREARSCFSAVIIHLSTCISKSCNRAVLGPWRPLYNQNKISPFARRREGQAM